MEKFIEYLQEAEKKIRTVDHLIYMSFPIIKEKRLLLKIFEDIKTIITNCINAILQYEYLYKRIRLSQNPKTNLETFKIKCAPKYGLTKEDISEITELFDIVEKHKESPIEFVKENKIIILSENMKQKTVKIEKTKELLLLTKRILQKSKEKILRKI